MKLFIHICNPEWPLMALTIWTICKALCKHTIYKWSPLFQHHHATHRQSPSQPGRSVWTRLLSPEHAAHAVQAVPRWPQHRRRSHWCAGTRSSSTASPSATCATAPCGTPCMRCGLPGCPPTHLLNPPQYPYDTQELHVPFVMVSHNVLSQCLKQGQSNRIATVLWIWWTPGTSLPSMITYTCQLDPLTVPEVDP